MARFRFELATPDDDAGLREVLRETQMPGSISLQFLREPDFFRANCVLGEFHQTIVCRDTTSGEIVGCGCRSVREMMVDGQPQPVGYLSMLRGKQRFRSLGLMARGYQFLRELHQDGRAPFYLSTIAEGNDSAINLLTSGRANLPTYNSEGSFTTSVISCRKSLSAKCPDGSVVRTACESDLNAILNFLESQSLRRQYFPRYRREDFLGPSRTFAGLQLNDIWIAIDGSGDIVGTMGLWDQRHFRQTVIQRYQGPLSKMRALYNVWANISGRVRLPNPGDQLNYAFVAFPIVRDPGLFPWMLKQVVERASSMGLEYVLIGSHDHDPQSAVINRMAERSYRTKLFRVTWNDGIDRAASALAHADNRGSGLSSPYLETGCL